MIAIKKNPTADSRTCDVDKVNKELLLSSSQQHIIDVFESLEFFIDHLAKAGLNHDHDKIYDIDRFYQNFKTKFKDRDWLDDHYKLNRHHLLEERGIPEDVTLIDVLEFIADCVSAGKARSGHVREFKLSNDLLQRAFKNTVKLLDDEMMIQ